MIIYTLYDYFKLYPYVLKKGNNKLSDNRQKYNLDKANNIKMKQHHKHDKLFRDILNNNKEVAKLINRYVEPKEQITEDMIEKYDTKFLTNIYEEKEADIVYKLKSKEIFFLVEHQIRVDKLMQYRILEYSLEIIRTRMKNIKESIEKVGIPKVIPLVIYTGQAKWTAKEKLEEVQVEFEHLKGIDVITGYNLIDIRSEQEAIKDGTAIARMSVIERKNDTEDIIEVVKRMSKHIKDKEDRQEFAEEIKYLLSDKLTKEEIEKIEEILIEREGEEAMLHAQMVIRRDFEKAREEGRKEGMLHAQEVIRRDFEKAKEEGRREIKEKMKKEQLEKLINMAKGFIKENVSVDVVEKITGLKKEQFM